MTQEYEKYTAEDREVWKILFERQMATDSLPKMATREFVEGLGKVDFREDVIPHFGKTSEKLRELTGWELTVVPGIVDDAVFFGLMADRKFPATTWLRKMEELDYLEEPDMFHDVFAHVPLLSNQAFVDFLQALSKLALDHSGDAWAIELLSRIYWFTIEFGLIRENGELRIYGAGILSSAGESKYSLSKEPLHFEYNVEQIFNTPYRKDIFQDRYFIIESYEQLYQSMPEIVRVLDKMLAETEKTK
jgi:phenylalanine-4-hydroxylase